MAHLTSNLMWLHILHVPHILKVPIINVPLKITVMWPYPLLVCSIVCLYFSGHFILLCPHRCLWLFLRHRSRYFCHYKMIAGNYYLMYSTYKYIPLPSGAPLPLPIAPFLPAPLALATLVGPLPAGPGAVLLGGYTWIGGLYCVQSSNNQVKGICCHSNKTYSIICTVHSTCIQLELAS